MSAKTSISWIGAAIGGAVAALVAFFVLNNFVVINGVGPLKGLDPPWSDFYCWGLAGGLLGAAGSVFAWHRRRVHAREVAEAALLLGLDYAAEVAREDLGEAGQLRLFGKWAHAAHHLTGRMDRMPIQVLDYTYVDKGEDSSSYVTQTVVLLPGAEHVPAFALRPRDLTVRVLGLLGVRGITFDPAGAGPEVAPVVEQFNRHYHLALGLENQLLALAEQVEDPEAARSMAPPEEMVRRLFSPELLGFFAAHPGWFVESNGRHLALWRKAVVRGPARSQFLAEALEARHAIAESRRPARTAVVPARPPADPLRNAARGFGTALGAAAGFIAGFFLSTNSIFRPGPFKIGVATLLIVFGAALCGLVVGALLGYLILAHPVFWALRRRQARERQAIADSPWGQPLGSTAQVQEQGNRLLIDLPAPGLRRGVGSFVFAWCCLWNGILVVFTALWLPAALLGQVKWGDGNQAVPPLLPCLFLVPFWLIGISALVVVLYQGRRRARLVVDSRHLWFEETTLFGVKQHDWQRQELADVQASPSIPGLFAGKWEIRLMPHQGEPTGLLSWRDRKELKWLAGLVREKWQIHP
jgi:hypothetical protein